MYNRTTYARFTKEEWGKLRVRPEQTLVALKGGKSTERM